MEETSKFLLTPHEAKALIWLAVSLITILIAIGWFYIQSSIKAQKEISSNVQTILISQAEVTKDVQRLQEDMQEIKEDFEILSIRQREVEKLVYFKK